MPLKEIPMFNKKLSALAILLSLFLIACPGPKEETVDAPPEDVPSEQAMEENNAAPTVEITEDNAEAEADKLLKELDEL